jgi:hypothetical protein
VFVCCLFVGLFVCLFVCSFDYWSPLSSTI